MQSQHLQKNIDTQKADGLKRRKEIKTVDDEKFQIEKKVDRADEQVKAEPIRKRKKAQSKKKVIKKKELLKKQEVGQITW